MGFSVFVEMINLRVRKHAQPVALHRRFSEEDHHAEPLRRREGA
jgi:hypothetical protein